ncbi:hypothetical protein [Paenibacillus sp. NPDC058174]|uniref:hypothetical protein n=1 Tax=Paenibacillus sp. NPDC058174 TaxID=3346366 RepID=UPI0036D7684F
MNAVSSAILFDFADAASASVACDTLQELGYEPMLHEGNRVHIHVDGVDLTSALEIAQAHGGRLVEQASIRSEAITNTAYSLDAITIPAHVVNEDLNMQDELDEGLHNWNDDADEYRDEFKPDDGSYNRFSG